MTELPRSRPAALRIALIAALAAAVIVIGHWGVPSLRSRSGLGRTSGVVKERAGRLSLGEGRGADAGDIPRPPASRRIGVIAASGADGNVTLRYLAPATAEEVAQFYRNRMPALGWRAHPAAGPAREDDASTVLSYSNRTGNSCIITVSETPDGTGVTIMRLRREEPR